MAIRAHHRGIKQVNHNLFSFSFFGTKWRDRWDGDVCPFVFGFTGPTLQSNLKYPTSDLATYL